MKWNNIFFRDLDSAYIHIYTRDCIVCETAVPECPVCGDDEECSLSPQTCTSCPMTYCKSKTFRVSTTTNTTQSATSTPSQIPDQQQQEQQSPRYTEPVIGAIAGGIAALFLIVLVIYWQHWRAHKSEPSHKKRRILSSNIIPIAYIPGVKMPNHESTNENGSGSQPQDLESVQFEEKKAVTAMEGRANMVEIWRWDGGWIKGVRRSIQSITSNWSVGQKSKMQEKPNGGTLEA